MGRVVAVQWMMTTPSEAHLGFLDFESDEIWAYGLLAQDAWHDERRVLRVARTVADDGGRVGTSKPGHARNVDVSEKLAALLGSLDAARTAEALGNTQGHRPARYGVKWPRNPS